MFSAFQPLWKNYVGFPSYKHFSSNYCWDSHESGNWKCISGTDELINGVGRILGAKNFDISLRKKLITSFYQISTPPVSSVFNSVELTNKGIEENT